MRDQRGAHEHRKPPPPTRGGSDRAFGVLVTVVFAVIGCWPLLRDGMPRWWALGIAAVALAVALAAPRWLAPLNRVWFRFGMLLHRVASPVVMGVVYFGVVTPTGLLMRLFGKDPLRLKRDPAAQTYWIDRDPPGPPKDSMANQF